MRALMLEYVVEYESFDKYAMQLPGVHIDADMLGTWLWWLRQACIALSDSAVCAASGRTCCWKMAVTVSRRTTALSHESRSS